MFVFYFVLDTEMYVFCLQSLDLSYNEIRSPVVQSLVDWLKAAAHLRTCNIDGNVFSQVCF